MSDFSIRCRFWIEEDKNMTHLSVGKRLTAAMVAVLVTPLISARAVPATPTPGALLAPDLVSPGAAGVEALVLDRCPTFSWTGVAGADHHELVIYRTGTEDSRLTNEEPVVRALLPQAATSWTPSASLCLEPGGSYAWSVGAVSAEDDPRDSWADAWFFRVSSGPSISEVEEALSVLRRYSNELLDAQRAEGPEHSSARTADSPGVDEQVVLSPSGLTGGRPVQGALSTTDVPSPANPPTDAATPAPTLGTASLTVDEQIHLGSASDFFRNNEVFLWADSSSNLALGGGALAQTSSGGSNTAIGKDVLRFNTTGFANSSLGRSSLTANTIGFGNSAFGVASMRYNEGGYRNSAFGAYSLLNNTTAVENSAFGHQTLFLNETGNGNSAFGQKALFRNQTGDLNSGFGHEALYHNETGLRNTALGREAMFSSNSTDGTAVGDRALRSNTEGLRNTAVGARALFSSTTGEGNVALGWLSGYELLEGDDNIMIGSGVTGLSTDDKTIRIGIQGTQTRTHIAGISGINLSNGANVVVESDGRLGVGASSQRFKEDVTEMEDVSALLSALRPVRFRYKEEHSSSDERPRQYGLIAEEVARVVPELVARGTDGRPFAVRYDLLSTLLLQELRRLSRENDSVDLTQARLLGAQRNEIEELKRQVERLARRRER